MLENIKRNNKTLYYHVILQHVNNISILLTLNPLRLTLGVGVSKYIKTYVRDQVSAFKYPTNTHMHKNSFCVNTIANDLNNNIPKTDTL